MALLGVNAMIQLAIPVGWDATYLRKYQAADGTSYEEITNQIAQGLVAINSAMMNDPLWGGLVYRTDSLAAQYRSGGSNGMEERTEYRRADAKRAETVGHMLPLRSYDRGMGWTWDYLRYATAPALDADVADAMDDVRDKWEINLLSRFFDSDFNQIETSGYDAPFVNGTSNVINYTPTKYGGLGFANTHNHFLRYGTTAQADALNAAAKHLWEHGIFGPYDAIVPFADIATYAAMTNFIKPNRGVDYVSVGSNAPYAQFQVNDERYIGLYESNYGLIRLWINPHLPTNYLGVYKNYGTNDPRNPLYVRFAPDLGEGAILMRGEGFREFPLEHALIIHEYGVGVQPRRVNGVAVFFAASGDYVDPVIS